MSEKMNTSEFIEKARKVHGNKYDYSKVDYVNNHTKVCIICPKHGEFWQTPHNHLNGSGCPNCIGNIKKTTFEFIEKAKKVHGDKYIYDKVNYVNRNTKVCIICPKHGEFWQIPSSHLQGKGCPNCANSNSFQTTTEFIEKAKKVHGDKYIYDKVNYVNSNTKVCIICPKHGEFLQIPSSHLQGTGCPNCGVTHKKTAEEFIKKAKEKHGDKYDYSKVDYINNKTKVCIICPKHGEFLQIPSSHLNGSGCPKCVGKNKTTAEFVEGARKIHGNKYDYSKVEYKGAYTKVCIICPEHGEFWQFPHSHLNDGQGCPICGIGLTKSYLLSLITEYDLLNMDEYDLITIIQSGILPKSFSIFRFSKMGSKERKDAIKDFTKKLEDDSITEEEFEKEEEEKYKQEEERLKNQYSSKNEDEMDEKIINSIIESDKINNDENFIKSLKIFNDQKFKSFNGEYEKFIIINSVHRLWNKTLSKENEKERNEFLNKLKSEKCTNFFAKILDIFFTEYNEVISMKVDKNCIFPHIPNLMQKLMAFYVKTHNCFGNWCGTGSGKSFARDWIAHIIDAKISVYFCPNAVIESTINAINEEYNDMNVIVPKTYSDIIVHDNNKRTVFLLNYDKIQDNNGGDAWTAELLKHKIDFICLDEVQKVKVREVKNASSRNKNMKKFIKSAKKLNPDIKLHFMSATPITNNLTEVRELMELLTGFSHSEIGSKVTMDNIYNAHKALMLNGFRYVPKYEIEIKIENPVIDGNDILEFLKKCQDDIKAEKILIDKKTDWCIRHNKIKKGTIIFTHFVNGGIVKSIKEKLEKAGFKVGCYTGNEDDIERLYNFSNFCNNKIDVLIGSDPIIEGIDGFQKICNNMICLSLPWTYTGWNQLVGRIYRPGSIFGEINIIVPKININGWSIDERRSNIIKYKKTLGEAVIDGSFSNGYNNHNLWKNLFKNALKSLRDGLYDKKVIREEIEVDDINVTINKRETSESLINSIHQKANTCNHKNISNKVFNDNENDFREYHRIRRESINNNWISDPIDKVAEIINSYKEKIYENIIDLGCGENLLKTKVINGNNRVIGVDVQKIDDTVIKADCGNLKGIINDESKQIAVHCLSLWGNDYLDNIREDYRILESGINAILIIVEPNDKFGENKHFNTEDNFIKSIEEIGFKKNGNSEIVDGFKFFQFTK